LQNRNLLDIMKKLLLNICLLFVVAYSANAQKLLQYNLKVNDTILIHQVANQDIIQDINGSSHEMKNLLEANYIFIVRAANDTTYTIDFAFKKFKMDTTSNLYGNIMSVDTTKDITEDDVEGKIFAGLVDVKLTMIMQKNGKITSVEGTENLINKMVDGANVDNEFTRQIMIEAMKKEFGNESLSSSFEQMTYIYPDAEVAVGDTWNNSYVGDLIAKNSWTLVNNSDDKIDLSAKSTVEIKSIEDQMTMTLKGNQNTTIEASLPTGFIKTMTVISNAEGITVMKQMNGIEIPTTIKSVTEYSIK